MDYFVAHFYLHCLVGVVGIETAAEIVVDVELYNEIEAVASGVASNGDMEDNLDFDVVSFDVNNVLIVVIVVVHLEIHEAVVR